MSECNRVTQITICKGTLCKWNNKISYWLPCSWRQAFLCSLLATLSGQCSAEGKMDNKCVCFYLASFKTTLWEAVFIRTLLERVSPGWLTDWLWWGFIRLLHISLWSTHLQGLSLSLPASFHFFYACSLVLSDQANPWSPLNPQWLRAQSIRRNDVKLLSNEYLVIRETVCAGRLMRGFSSRRLCHLSEDSGLLSSNSVLKMAASPWSRGTYNFAPKAKKTLCINRYMRKHSI